MQKENFKKGTRFKIVGAPGPHNRIWVCVEVAHRLVVALDETRATARLRRRYGSEDDVVPAQELARLAPEFDDFLILWEHEFLYCHEL